LEGRSVLTPDDLAAIRFGVSGIVLTPIFLWGRRSFTPLQLMVLAILGGLCYGL
jgi:hypothetical protein